MSTPPQLRSSGPFRVAGFITRASHDDPSPIGGVWQTFMTRSGEFAGGGPPLAVYHDYESDYRGAYSLLVGLPADAAATPPPHWQTLDVPRDTYLVFAVPPGPMPDVLMSAWQSIWEHFDADCPYERTYAFDYESHGDPTEIHIAVRRRG